TSKGRFELYGVVADINATITNAIQVNNVMHINIEEDPEQDLNIKVEAL
ncbi:4224_t:CDS:2, partial [Ambispora gerdemannii]